jgi:hypothetical protein
VAQSAPNTQPKAPKPDPKGPATDVDKWNLKIASVWMKGVARLRPDDVLDTHHSEEKGQKRSISQGNAVDVIRTGIPKDFEGPYEHGGLPSVKVTFLKQYRARTLRVVAAAKEGSPFVQLVSLQNVW